MFKISIVPDTNILLSNLELIKSFYSTNIAFPFTLNFARTVISELDGKKNSMTAARKAIKFIETISSSLKTEIEGMIDDRKIDVIIDTRDPISALNNDDKILNYCFSLENPILLSNDKAFYLKCLTFNIKAVIVDNKSNEDVIKSILIQFGIEPLEMNSKLDALYLEKVKILLKETLWPTIYLIIQRELGTNYDLAMDKDANLEYYLEFVIKNFYIFRNFLPSQAPEIIKQFLTNLKEKNVRGVKQLIHPICMIFRKAAPEDII